MEADVILGYDIGTYKWIKELKKSADSNIIVLDYDYYGEPVIISSILFISPADLKDHLHQYEKIRFYKSMYSLPGMNGRMSLLYKRNFDS